MYMSACVCLQLAEEASHGDASKHAKCMQNNRPFYVDWLMPVVRAFCQHKQWDQFTVKLLGRDGEPEEDRDYSMPGVVFS
jgi:hypothetical protein